MWTAKEERKEEKGGEIVMLPRLKLKQTKAEQRRW